MERDILTFIREVLLPDQSESVGVETSLFAARVLDSMSLMELVAFVEERCGVKVGPMDLVYENFDKVSSIVRFVGRRQPLSSVAPQAET